MRGTAKPWLEAALLTLLCAAPDLGAQEARGAPRRTIAADGSVEIRTPEGTVRRIPPADPAAGEGLAGEGLGAALLTPADLGLLDPAVKSERLEALREFYAYRAQGYRHRRKTFEWQLFSSKIIFVSVLTVVFAGIYFAAVQFHIGLSRKGRARQADVVTEIDASLKGIRVSSPVLGVLILTLSLVFFYLYLAYVYPIHETF